jgi:hypothetical protein
LNASTALLRALLERGDYLEAFSQDELRRILPILEAAHESVLGRIAATNGVYTAEWLADTAAELDEIYNAAALEAYHEIRPGLVELARDEGAWIGTEAQRIAIGISFASPAPSLLAAVLNLPTSIKGSTLEQLFEGMAESTRGKVYEAIQAGALAGDTVHNMTVRLRGRADVPAHYLNTQTGKRIVGVAKKQLKAMVKRGDAEYVPGVYSGGALSAPMNAVTTTQAEALAITSTSHVSNRARDIFYGQNDEIFSGYQCYETLDAVTCIACGVLDGHRYKIDELLPELPRHIRCRGGYVPILKSWRELGVDAQELPEGTRASMDGQVAESKTWTDLVAEMGDRRLKRVLGPGRATLYRQGVRLDEMVSEGKVILLKDMAGRFHP